MSTRHVRTAGDLLRFKCALRVECGGCGYTQTLSGVKVFMVCGPGQLDAIQPRLKCSRCNAKRARLTVLLPPSRH